MIDLFIIAHTLRSRSQQGAQPEKLDTNRVERSPRANALCTLNENNTSNTKPHRRKTRNSSVTYSLSAVGRTTAHTEVNTSSRTPGLNSTKACTVTSKHKGSSVVVPKLNLTRYALSNANTLSPRDITPRDIITSLASPSLPLPPHVSDAIARAPLTIRSQKTLQFLGRPPWEPTNTSRKSGARPTAQTLASPRVSGNVSPERYIRTLEAVAKSCRQAADKLSRCANVSPRL
eukprot:1185251-Prorocentrum_minimum.AAC.3